MPRYKSKRRKKQADAITKEPKTSIRINEKDFSYIEALAQWDRRPISETVAEAISDYVIKRRDIVIEAMLLKKAEG